VAAEIQNRGTIPSDMLPRIFEPFSSRRQFAKRGEGLGLGLFIARAIPPAHSLALEVHSSNGTTEFRLVLPCHPPSAVAGV
jgi:nitrogen-specific signal transduction histidine kinase